MPRRAAAALALIALCALAAVAPACSDDDAPRKRRRRDPYARERKAMVADQLEARGIRERDLLEAMRKVPRHEFVPERVKHQAYEDHALPIDEGQTISQPYIVGLMTQLAAVKQGDRVLEIGTGAGYQAAILAELGCRVYTVEIVEPLARSAERRLERLGYGKKVRVRAGDGWHGWAEHGPYDAIIVTTAAPELPPPLVEQLALGGKLVIPVGRYEQQLVVVAKTRDGVETTPVIPVLFGKMAGEAEKWAY